TEGSDACSATGEDSPDTIIVCIGWIWTFWASRVGNRTRTAPFASMSSTVSLQDLNEVTASVIFCCSVRGLVGSDQQWERLFELPDCRAWRARLVGGGWGW